MKISIFRGLFLGCFALMAAVFSISSPAVASTEYVIHPDFVFVIEDIGFDELVLIAPSEAGIVQHDEMKVPTPSIADPGPIHPVYALSYRTAGHSLIEHHLRC